MGVAFKPETNDIRQAPSVSVIKSLLNLGANVVACDPKALDSAKKIFKDEIEYEIDPYKALKNADSLLLITQWQEFLELDFQKVSKVMKQKIIFDGRNVYNAQSVRNLGFEYFGIGCR